MLLLHQLDGISDVVRALAGGSTGADRVASGASRAAATSTGAATSSDSTFSGSSAMSSTAGGLFPRPLFARRPRLGQRAGFLGLSTVPARKAAGLAPADSGGSQVTTALRGNGAMAAADALQWPCVAEALCGGSLVGAEVAESFVEALLQTANQSLDQLCRRLKLRDDDEDDDDGANDDDRSGGGDSGADGDAQPVDEAALLALGGERSPRPKFSETEPLLPRGGRPPRPRTFSSASRTEPPPTNAADASPLTSTRSLTQSQSRSRLTVLVSGALPSATGAALVSPVPLLQHRASSLRLLATTKRWEQRLRGALSEEGVVEESILLFCAAALLRSLSGDSAAVRDTLHLHERGGSSSALRAALGMLQTLCPRVNRPALVALQQPASASSAAPPTSLSVSSLPPLALSSSFRASADASLAASPSKWAPSRPPRVFVCEACVVDEFTPGSALATAEAERQAFLAPYEERWQLLVTARLNLEDAARLASLPLPASFTAVRPLTDLR